MRRDIIQKGSQYMERWNVKREEITYLLLLRRRRSRRRRRQKWDDGDRVPLWSGRSDAPSGTTCRSWACPAQPGGEGEGASAEADLGDWKERANVSTLKEIGKGNSYSKPSRPHRARP